MDSSTWSKICDLIGKTGDRCIIADGDDIFVAMGLNSYEKLVFGKSEVKGLTEDELLDKMNRDIAVWQSANREEDKNETADFEIAEDEDDEDADQYYIEPVE
ncbi:MAG: hypothetical protein V1928_04740 [Parcubacteria group bacterium]